MFRFLVFSLLGLVACICSAAAYQEHEVNSNNRIIGGTAANIVNHPHQLSLVFGMFHICGATIIASTWALTSASCVLGLTAANFRLRAGSGVINDGGTLHQVTRITPHGSFNPTTMDFDIAVMQISGAFPLGTLGVNTVAMPAIGTRPAAGVQAVATGWGATVEGGSLATNLQGVTVPIISMEACRAIYGNIVTDRMLCAGHPAGGTGPCQGDQGGPLVTNNFLIGIVSWSMGCARANLPGVYVCVGTLRQWIDNNIVT